MSYQATSTPLATPASQVVHCKSARPVDSNKLFRHYGSHLAASTPIHGVTQTNRLGIQYRVGLGATDRKACLKVPSPTAAIAQTFTPNEVTSSTIASVARKYSNFSGQFDRADFSGLIARLAQCVGVYALTFELDFNEVKGQKPLSIRTLSVLDDPVAATPGALFIPRGLADAAKPDVFSAIVAAANSLDCTVITDICSVDANNNAPTIRTPSGSELALACWQGIHLLLAQMDESDAGAMGAYALTCGLHRAVTVVGHTDEGGYIRDVLRAQSFAVPYGGVFCANAGTFTGLPMPDVTSNDSFVAIVDGLCLLTAGVSALSDPLISYRGRDYPTILAAVSAKKSGGKASESVAAYSIELSSSAAATCSGFADLYVRNLARAAGVSDGGLDVARVHLEASFAALAGQPNRHLNQAVVAPYYWIEPTSLIDSPASFVGPAQEAGYGVYTGKRDATTLQYFENIKVARGGSAIEQWYFTWRSARTCGAVLFHRYNKSDGLGALHIRQAAYDGFALRGGTQEDVRISVERGADLTEYLWERGDCSLPAPAELLYTGEAIGAHAVKCTIDYDTWDTAVTNLKDAEEVGVGVTMRTGAPNYIGTGGLGERNKCVRRARTAAAASLSATRMGARKTADWLTGSEDMAIMGESPVAWLTGDDVPTVSGVVRADVTPPPPRQTARGAPAAKATLMGADQFRAPRPPGRQDVVVTVAKQPVQEAAQTSGARPAVVETDSGEVQPLQAGGASSAPPAQ